MLVGLEVSPVDGRVSKGFLKETNKSFLFVSHDLHRLFIHNLAIQRVDIIPDLVIITIVVVVNVILLYQLLLFNL